MSDGDSAEEYLIEDLKPGMKLGEDIENSYGGVLIFAGTILTFKLIDKLTELAYEKVKVKIEPEGNLDQNISRITQAEVDYRKSIEDSKSLFDKVKRNDKIEYREIRSLTEDALNLGENLNLVDLLNMVRDADEYTYSHLMNLAILGSMFADWLKLSGESKLHLSQAGLLHDIGKAKIPDDILNKPGELTPSEYEVMQDHSAFGYKMIEDAGFAAEETALAVLTHHERWDGSGYPFGLKGEKIPLYGRILAIIDTFDAITANRIYKPGESPFHAIKVFTQEESLSYDYELKKVFLDKIPDYFVKENVLLNDGRSAEIIFINPRHPDRPIVVAGGEYLDLYNRDDLDIIELLKE
ncbi:MAG: HD-GYP domain-containing protein [Bacillota bacterium]